MAGPFQRPTEVEELTSIPKTSIFESPPPLSAGVGRSCDRGGPELEAESALPGKSSDEGPGLLSTQPIIKRVAADVEKEDRQRIVRCSTQ